MEEVPPDGKEKQVSPSGGLFNRGVTLGHLRGEARCYPIGASSPGHLRGYPGVTLRLNGPPGGEMHWFHLAI